jgi:tight adherence protein B
MLTTTVIICLMVFVAAAALVGVLGFVLRGDGERASARLDTLVGKRRGGKDTQADILRKTAFEGDRKSLLELIAPKRFSLQKYFEQADCHIKPNTLLLIGLGLAAFGLTLSWVARVPWFFMPVSAAVLFLVPLVWVWNKRRKRLKVFASQLPDALELVARALRAGHSLGAGMHVVAEEMPSPIAEEFGRVFEEQNLGISIEESMQGLCERVPNLDLRFFVTSVAIQRQTGGDLAEILDKIGYVIRERYRILGQVKALTAEGRLSGVVLIALPFVLFLVMLHIQPSYVAALWTHPTGQMLSIFAIVMQILGAVVIRKIVNIKV